MKVLKTVSVLVVITLVAVAIAAPLGPMPGLFIGGSASATPASWGDTHSVQEIHLQVGAGPIGRTVIIWVVQVGGDLYVTGQKDSGWTRGIGAGGPVRMQMAGKLYELNATPVTDGQIGLLTAWQRKYSVHYPEAMGQFPPPEEAVRTAAVFRLTART